MNPVIQLKQTTSVFLVALLLACFGVLPQTQAVLPPEIPGNPDGCYPAFTTAEGCNALALLGAGIGNTAIGWYSLFLAGNASFNTGVGAGALALTTTGADSNTAVGTAAMLLNTSGTQNVAVGTDALLFNDNGSDNNAVGAFALFNNIDGFFNNAFGDSALFENIHGSFNTAIGHSALENNDSSGNGTGAFNTAVGNLALLRNIDGFANTAVGSQALQNNDSTGNGFGNRNTAVGDAALFGNTDGFRNNAVGRFALVNNTIGSSNEALGVNALATNDSGSNNIAIGDEALINSVSGDFNTVVGFVAGSNLTSSFNTLIGAGAGSNLTMGGNNICIGSGINGIAGEFDTIRIRDNNPQVAGTNSKVFFGGINGATVGAANAPVLINANNQLGTAVSSARYKKDIEPMDKSSAVIFSLRPVTFHYKGDETNLPCFGLIAEDVAKVNPDLILLDKEGKPLTVRYEQINAMLLNEFLKEHRKNEEQQATIARLVATDTRQQNQIEALTAALQKVSAQLELSKTAPQTVAENQ